RRRPSLAMKYVKTKSIRWFYYAMKGSGKAGLGVARSLEASLGAIKRGSREASYHFHHILPLTLATAMPNASELVISRSVMLTLVVSHDTEPARVLIKLRRRWPRTAALVLTLDEFERLL